VRHLLLVGRHGRLTPGATAAVSELETLGASVSVAAADVTDRVQMTEALAQVPSEAPLTAVFHAAGIVDATPLEALTPARLEEVLAAKRAGTLLLDELTIGRGLQAFVCFSSIAGVWGAGAQAAYAAANAFLDAWAQAARARGCPALAIAWGPWRSQGMASEEALSSLARRGLRALVPELALAALEQALLADLTHAVVVDVDWEKFRVAFEAWGPRALLAEIERLAPVETAHESEGHPVAAELARRPVAARAPYLRAWLLEQCVILLRHEPGTPLDVRRGFFDIGMDSLMLVELRDRLERGIGIRIAPGVFFSHSNIEALAEHLVTELEPKTSSLPELPPDGPESGETAVLDSDEDVLRFINAKFEGEDDRSGR
jgi:short-subunit dehydrogenase/acyl carrier protein